MHTAESIFSNFVIEYLGEIKTEFENTLACVSGAQMCSDHEKNWRSKISWHSLCQNKIFKTDFSTRIPYLLLHLGGQEERAQADQVQLGVLHNKRQS